MIILLVVGIFAIGKMIAIFTNPVLIGLVLLFSAVFYHYDKLSSKTIAFTGILVGFIWWVIGIAQFYGNASWLCNFPLLGGIVCGSVALISAFTDLLGYLLGGLVLSALIGGFLFLIKR